MPFTRSYPHLRGMVVDMREGGLVVTPDQPLTRSILVFGKALWGPVDEPVALSNIAEAEDIFGPLVDETGELTGTQSLTRYIDNEVLLQVWEAFSSGCSDVRAVRLELDGVQASLTLNLMTTTPSDGLIITAAYPGYLGNSFSVATCYTGEVNPTDLRIKIPTYLGGQTYKFTLSNYDTIQELINDVNRVMEGYVIFSLDTGVTATWSPYYLPVIASDTAGTWEIMASAVSLGSSPTTPGTYTGTAGTNDTTPTLTAVYDALGDPVAVPGVNPTALQNLREYEVDIIANSVYYVDEITGTGDNVLQRIVDFCHLQHKNGIPTSCVFGVSLLASPTRASIIARKNTLVDVANYPALLMTSGIASQSGDEDIQNAGRYCQIVAGPHCVAQIRTIGVYATNAAVHVAGLRSQYPQHKPLTFKPIPGLVNVVYKFTNSEMNALLGGVGTAGAEGGAFVVLGHTEGAITAQGGPTCALRNTDYCESYVLDIADAAIDLVRSIGKRYLGREFTIAHRMALLTQIKSGLTGMYEAGALVGGEDVGYKVNISQTDRERILGKLVVDLALRPTLELKYIELNISMQA